MDLQAAAARGDVKAVRSILTAGTEGKNWHITRSPLSVAAGEGHCKVVQLLINKGRLDPDEADKDGRTPLSWAARRGHKGVVKLLLARDDVHVDCKDEMGWTPLSWAAGNGHAEVTELLLFKKADIDSKDTDGRTPLSWAAAKGHVDVVDILLRRGASLGTAVDSKGRTPFLWAAFFMAKIRAVWKRKMRISVRRYHGPQEMDIRRP
jgi:ankyrin repeat protein